jgi:hypothetical protein
VKPGNYIDAHGNGHSVSSDPGRKPLESFKHYDGGGIMDKGGYVPPQTTAPPTVGSVVLPGPTQAANTKNWLASHPIPFGVVEKSGGPQIVTSLLNTAFWICAAIGLVILAKKKFK